MWKFLLSAVIQRPKSFPSCGSTLVSVLGVLSIYPVDGERESVLRIAEEIFMGHAGNRATLLLPTFHWSELSHMVSPNCKGAWEM